MQLLIKVFADVIPTENRTHQLKLVNECDPRWTMRVDNEGDSEGDPGAIITMSAPATIHLVLGQTPGLLNIPPDIIPPTGSSFALLLRKNNLNF